MSEERGEGGLVFGDAAARCLPRLAISASFAGAAQRIGQAPPNLLQACPNHYPPSYSLKLTCVMAANTRLNFCAWHPHLHALYACIHARTHVLVPQLCTVHRSHERSAHASLQHACISTGIVFTIYYRLVAYAVRLTVQASIVIHAILRRNAEGQKPYVVYPACFYFLDSDGTCRFYFNRLCLCLPVVRFSFGPSSGQQVLRGKLALLRLTPPRGFELMASVPRTSRGVLVKAGSEQNGQDFHRMPWELVLRTANLALVPWQRRAPRASASPFS